MHRILVLILLSCGILTANAQQAITVAGANASGSGGSVTYSIGQIAYTTHSDSGGTIAQGVQLPYELSVKTGIDKPFISLQLEAYPNPTTGVLILNVGTASTAALNLELYDMGGKLIEKRKISCQSETVCMDYLPSATYFLKVTDNYIEVKTFKIIKN